MSSRNAWPRTRWTTSRRSRCEGLEPARDVVIVGAAQSTCPWRIRSQRRLGPETGPGNAAANRIDRAQPDGGGYAGHFSRCDAGESTMHPGGIVVMLELVQLAHQIRGIPEEHAVEVLAPDRADQAFDKGMRNRRVRNRLGGTSLLGARSVAAPRGDRTCLRWSRRARGAPRRTSGRAPAERST